MNYSKLPNTNSICTYRGKLFLSFNSIQNLWVFLPDFREFSSCKETQQNLTPKTELCQGAHGSPATLLRVWRRGYILVHGRVHLSQSVVLPMSHVYFLAGFGHSKPGHRSGNTFFLFLIFYNFWSLIVLDWQEISEGR